MIRLDPKIKFPMIIIGIIAAVSLFAYIQHTTEVAMDRLINTIEEKKNCDCD